MIGAFRANGGEAVAVMSANADRAEITQRSTVSRMRRPMCTLAEANDIDAVYISTTNELHHDQALAAARPASMCCAKSRWR